MGSCNHHDRPGVRYDHTGIHTMHDRLSNGNWNSTNYSGFWDTKDAKELKAEFWPNKSVFRL